VKGQNKPRSSRCSCMRTANSWNTTTQMVHSSSILGIFSTFTVLYSYHPNSYSRGLMILCEITFLRSVFHRHGRENTSLRALSQHHQRCTVALVSMQHRIRHHSSAWVHTKSIQYLRSLFRDEGLQQNTRDAQRFGSNVDNLVDGLAISLLGAIPRRDIRDIFVRLV
jgi:hypothetical protein